MADTCPTERRVDSLRMGIQCSKSGFASLCTNPPKDDKGTEETANGWADVDLEDVDPLPGEDLFFCNSVTLAGSPRVQEEADVDKISMVFPKAVVGIDAEDDIEIPNCRLRIGNPNRHIYRVAVRRQGSDAVVIKGRVMSILAAGGFKNRESFDDQKKLPIHHEVSGREIINLEGLKALKIDVMRKILGSNSECKFIVKDEEKAKEDRLRRLKENWSPGQVQAWDILVKARLWKMNENAAEEGGNPMDERSWLPRDVWVKDDGVLWYHSEKEQKDLQYFNGLHVGKLDVMKLAEGAVPYDFGFTIAPQKEFKMVRGQVREIEVTPATFGTDDEEVYETFTEGLAEMLEAYKKESPSGAGHIVEEEAEEEEG